MIIDTPYAHSLAGRPRTDWHPLLVHLQGSARLAEGFAEAFDSGEWGRLAGLWHDLGKYSEAFQDYLLGSAGPGDGVHRRRSAGTSIIRRPAPSTPRSSGRRAGSSPIASRAITPGCPTTKRQASPRSGAGWRRQIEPIDAAPAELLAEPAARPLAPGRRPTAQAFALAFYTRMLFSCLVDADFLATEGFIDPDRAGLRPAGRLVRELLDRLDRHLAERATRGR